MRNFEVGGFCAMISGARGEREKVIRQLSELDQPVVVFQEEIAAPGRDICTVRQDDRGGGRLVGDHLLARRVEDLMMVVPRQDWPAIENRVAGVRDSLAASGGAAVDAGSPGAVASNDATSNDTSK